MSEPLSDADLAAIRERAKHVRPVGWNSDDKPMVDQAQADLYTLLAEIDRLRAELASRPQVVLRGELKPRQAFAPIRVAVTGSKISPGLYESLALLGREESLARLNRAVARAGAATA